MVQKKLHKGKLKSQQACFKPKDGKELSGQLEAFGLRIVQITADGNCLFRAVADQLEGNEEEHSKYRKMVVDYIEGHQKDYEPFLEDDVPFDDYCKNMRETSTWAGHMELQLSSPRWHIYNFSRATARCIHLSYHNGEHYNSVRRKDDSGGGPAKSILLETPVMEERKDAKGKAARMRYPSDNSTSKKAQTLVTEEKIYEKDDDAENICNQSISDSDPDAPSKMMGPEIGEDVNADNGGDSVSYKPSQQVQKVARNKACPCGSKKKYKACCGAATPKQRAMASSSAIEGLSNKARKQKLRNNKVQGLWSIYPAIFFKIDGIQLLFVY
ncbi:hypothetical protein GOP47_0016438 [Adiantum capillus-veneris]|uniref:OTU domain-containing protein n=1 Tax=Adiantum capillus-veneris TaxID=13818 RepID=A0A9D4ZAA2_ADICA|nr:hypothetical protein GOP47_0016438 [Adiantum capillus-veneris]